MAKGILYLCTHQPRTVSCNGATYLPPDVLAVDETPHHTRRNELPKDPGQVDVGREIVPKGDWADLGSVGSRYRLGSALASHLTIKYLLW